LRSALNALLLLLMGVATSPSADGIDGAPFLKAPYLLFDGTTTEMTVIWQLPDARRCLIEWGTDTTCSVGSALTTEYGTEHMHAHTITGLSPSTKYYYRVSCAGVQCPGSFFSAPETIDPHASFTVYGDTRTNYMTHDAIAAVMVANYTALPEYQSIVFALGDLVTNGATESSWQNEFFNDAQTHLRQRMREVPLVSCIGNHELHDSLGGNDLDTPLFGQYFPYPYADRRYWSLNYGPAHITVVDQYPSDYDPAWQGLISPTELAWIENDLSTSSSPWKFIILHEPGWSCGTHENNQDVQDLLQPLCEEYGVQIVFGGHNHNYARACMNGVYHLTTGGGGAPLHPPQPDYPNVITALEVNHFCRVDIDQDVLTLTAVDLRGSVIDSFNIVLDQQISHLLGSVSFSSWPASLEDVLISAGGSSDHPDGTGYYGMRLDPGTYDVTASLQGYETRVFEDVQIFAGTETTLDIEMSQTSIEDVAGPGYPALLRTASPNPFCVSTTVRFELSESGPVRLDVFDVSGRLVETLVDDVLQTGEYTSVLEATGLSPGIYLFRLETINGLDTGVCVKL
jgi:hypothetical protein